MKYNKFLFVLLLSMTLAACGGGEKEADDTDDDTEKVEVEDSSDTTSSDKEKIPTDFTIYSSSPYELFEIGDEFEFTLDLYNDTSDDHELKTVDIQNEFLDAVEIVSIDPEPSDQYELNDEWTTFEFDQVIDGRTDMVITFTAEVLEEGEFYGDIEACINSVNTCLNDFLSLDSDPENAFYYDDYDYDDEAYVYDGEYAFGDSDLYVYVGGDFDEKRSGDSFEFQVEIDNYGADTQNLNEIRIHEDFASTFEVTATEPASTGNRVEGEWTIFEFEVPLADQTNIISFTSTIADVQSGYYEGDIEVCMDELDTCLLDYMFVNVE